MSRSPTSRRLFARLLLAMSAAVIAAFVYLVAWPAWPRYVATRELVDAVRHQEVIDALRPSGEDSFVFTNKLVIQRAGAVRAVHAEDSAAADLRLALKDGDPLVRWKACVALLELFPSARVVEDAVPVLLGLLKQDELDVRADSLKLLLTLAPAARKLIPTLIEALRDDDDRVRFAAAAMLGKLGPGAKAAVPALVAVLEQPDSGDPLTKTARNALKLIDSDAAAKAGVK